MQIFLDDQDYREFIHLLGRILENSRIRCWNYCIMPNHYHVTLQPTLPNLSAAIRQLNSAYAQWWNRRHDRVGHVFQGRFKDQLVDRESYLLALSRYVILNPVRAGLAAHPEEWQWSSYRATAGSVIPPAFLATELTLSLFGSGEVSEQQTRFAAAMVAAADETLADRIRSKDRILGPHAFNEAVRRLTRPDEFPGEGTDKAGPQPYTSAELAERNVGPSV
jgi:REP element-mobilizing transposase RayT